MVEPERERRTSTKDASSHDTEMKADSARKESDEGSSQVEEISTRGRISCLGYSEYYSSTLARAMSGDGRGGGARSGGFGSSGGPRIFCKGITIIPVTDDDSQKELGNFNSSIRSNISRKDEKHTTSRTANTTPNGNFSGRPSLPNIELWAPTVDQLRTMTTNMYRLVPVIARETKNAGDAFCRGANKVLRKMISNAQKAGNYVSSFVGRDSNSRKPPS